MAIDGAPQPSGRRLEAARRGARWALFSCVCMALAAIGAGCGRMQGTGGTSRDGFAVSMAAQPARPVVGDGTLIVSIRDPEGKPVEGAQLMVVGNMSHAGMKPSFGRVTAGGGGQYTVAIAWTMAGDWYVDMRAALADGRVITRRLPISVDAR